MKGLLVYILKADFGDCSAGGISSFCTKAILVASPDFPDVPEIFEADAKCPAVAIVKRDINGHPEPYLTAYPVKENDDGTTEIDSGGRSMGGCYIETSDSRFPARYPVPLHDRAYDGQ